MDMEWTIYVGRHDIEDAIALTTIRRTTRDATSADFGLSINEGRELLKALQHLVAQDQIEAYDGERRRCRHCGKGSGANSRFGRDASYKYGYLID